MPRTIINLEDTDKQWLDQVAQHRRVPMTELVREAVREYRVRQESADRPDLQKTLEQTAGIRRSTGAAPEDGLAHQERLRREWDERA